MTLSTATLPTRAAGFWVWAVAGSKVEIRFLGKGPSQEREWALKTVAGERSLGLAWVRQVHSAQVRRARLGDCGTGDAIITRQHRLALCVATADCMPIVIESDHTLAAVHVGWRGLVAGIIPATIGALGEQPARLRAWIGPAIGPCCYEVGAEVGTCVASIAGSETLIKDPRRPRLDLPLAARNQMAHLGLSEVSALSICTRCAPDWLWSFRRDGRGCGRNLTFAWRRRAAG